MRNYSSVLPHHEYAWWKLTTAIPILFACFLIIQTAVTQSQVNTNALQADSNLSGDINLLYIAVTLKAHSTKLSVEYCFHIDFCTWLLHVQTNTCTCIYTQEWAIIVACHHIMNMHDGN